MINSLPLFTYLIGLILMPIAIKIAKKNKWVVYPSDDRWHKVPTPFIGGEVIHILIIIPLLLLYLSPQIKSGFETKVLTLIIIGNIILNHIGVLDDFMKISPRNKFLSQIFVSTIVILFGMRLNWFSSDLLDIPLTIFWVIGIINAFNLIDNMDGLCAGIAFIIGFSLFMLIDGVLYFVPCIMMAALGAFYMYNIDGKIFMGDCGSLFIGFMIAVLCLVYTSTTNNYISVYVVPILLCFVPILDTVWVVFNRMREKRPIYMGGKDHLSHNLVYMGFKEWEAVLFLFAICCLSNIVIAVII